MSEKIYTTVFYTDARGVDYEFETEALMTRVEPNAIETEILSIQDGFGFPWNLDGFDASDLESIVDQVVENYDEGLFRLED